MVEHRVNQSDHYPSKYASIKRHRAIAAQSIHPSESLQSAGYWSNPSAGLHARARR